MEIPGMNPMQNRIAGPAPIPPGGGPQPQVPDLILDAPKTQPQAQPQAQPQGPGATTMPYQAPAQAVVQQVQQEMSAALMEMGMTPTPQNQQMAQMLASYGHGVNTQTMGILRQAMQALPDKSMATMEAAVILLSKDLPVNEQTVMAVKQFLNSAPLPQQLQNLPKELGALMQQLQQSASQAPAQAATQAAAQPQTAQTAAQVPQTANQAAAQPAAQAAQTPANAQAAAQSPNLVQAPPGSPQQQLQAQQTGQPAQQIQQQAQQIAQQVQSGQTVVQGAATSAIVQQAAGQVQSTQHRVDGVTGQVNRTTAEKVAVPDVEAESVTMIEEVDGQQSQAGQSRQVSQHLPSARPQDQQSLQQLYLHLQGGEPIDALKPGPAGIARTPEEALLQLLRTMQDLGQIAGHLGENMQLRDFGQLFIQHQQILQLTGLLEQKLQEFHQLFARAFPELSHDVQKLLQQDGLDMFSKLAQLIDENQAQIHERLKLTGGEEVLNQALSSLRGLMEQVGFQVEKVQAHMLAREMLSQNLPMHVVPLMVHFKGEAFPAEVCVQQDYDPGDPHSGPDGERPFKITLTLETKNMGRVAVDLATLKDDMMLDLKVQTRRIKLAVDDRLQELRSRVESDGDYKLSHIGCQVNPDLESRQSMLLPQKRVIRSLRRVEGVV